MRNRCYCTPAPFNLAYRFAGHDLSSNSSSETGCLLMHIYAPHGSAKAAADGSEGLTTLPVIVFLHGGEFVVGAASQAIYNASILASKANAVVVVVQYRLGALGFMAHPGLTAEAGFSGNYGLLDQQAALQWVYINAGYFGGNPSQVTIMGHGAGAQASLQHIAMAGSTDFFSRVVLQSAAAKTLPLLAEAEHAGVQLAVAVGCPAGPAAASLACLRSASTADIVSASMSAPLMPLWGPVVDGTHVQDQVWDLLLDPVYMRLALPGGMLLGLGRNDTTAALSFTLANTTVAGPKRAAADPAVAGAVMAMTPAQFSARANEFFAGATNVAAIVAFYSAQFGLPAQGSAGWSVPTTAAFAALSLALTDGSLLCPGARMLSAVNSSGLATYLYRLDHELSFVDTRLGASATMDTALAMQQPCFLTCQNYRGSFLPAETQLSNRIIDSFAAFARGASPGDATQAPQHNPIIGWTEFGHGHGPSLARLDVPVSRKGAVTDKPDACNVLWSTQNWP